MTNNDLVKCPLCQGHARMSRTELIGVLTDRNLREKIERYVAELNSAGRGQEQLAGVGVNGTRAVDFQKDVHEWNPQLPIWRRSPKE